MKSWQRNLLLTVINIAFYWICMWLLFGTKYSHSGKSNWICIIILIIPNIVVFAFTYAFWSRFIEMIQAKRANKIILGEILRYKKSFISKQAVYFAATTDSYNLYATVQYKDVRDKNHEITCYVGHRFAISYPPHTNVLIVASTGDSGLIKNCYVKENLEFEIGTLLFYAFISLIGVIGSYVELFHMI